MKSAAESTASRLARVVPGLVLVVVAGIQWWRTAAYDQVPWIGAGFGMFATVDGVDRVVVVRQQLTGRRVPIPSMLAAEAGALARVPTLPRLERLIIQLREELGYEVSVEIFAPEFVTSQLELRWREVEVR